jgi:hypothetical protein
VTLELDPDQTTNINTAWEFASDTQIKSSLTFKASTGKAIGWLGDASVGVSVQFGDEQGITSHGTWMRWEQVKDVGIMRRDIINAAVDGRLHEGESFVAGRQLTGKGVLFRSEGSNGSLKATAAAKIAPTRGLTIASLSGALIVVENKGAASKQDFADEGVLSARLLYLGKRGFFWHRSFVIYGIDRVESMNDIESLLSDRDYFQLL